MFIIKEAKQNNIDFTSLNAEQTKKLNKIAKKYRKAYTEYIDMLSILYGNEKYWWYTSIASRNTAIDTVFFDVCLLMMMLDEIEEKKPDCVIVKTTRIKAALKDNLQNSAKLKIICTKKNEETNFIRYVKRRIKSYLWKSHDRRDLKSIQDNITHIKECYTITDFSFLKNKSFSIVSTYVEEGEFKDNIFNDRYFPGLQENTDEEILFFLSPTMKKMEGSRVISLLSGMPRYIPYMAFIDDSDFQQIYCFIQWCHHFSINKTFFEGMDITQLVKYTIQSDAHNNNIFEGILKSRALIRMIERYHLKPLKLIEWYEGQPSSNIVVSQFRRKYREVPTIAYQISPCGENFLGIYPSKEQKKKKICAEYYAIQGDGWKSMTRQFEPSIKLLMAPSFRYKNLTAQKSSSCTDEYLNTILLVLSYSINDSRDLLTAFYDSHASMQFDRILVKNHPNNITYTLKDYGIKKSVKCEFINVPLNDIVKTVPLVLSGPSTSSIELLLGANKVIFFHPLGKLENNYLPENCVIPLIAYDAKDIDKCIELATNCQLNSSEKEKLYKLSFTPVNGITVKKFLELQIV